MLAWVEPTVRKGPQLNAAVYVRISSDPTGRRAGVERQEADCRAYCEAQGWTVARVYVDNDVSASSGKQRPAYAAMLEDARAGRIGAVVAYHLDRLHRRPVELEDFIALAEARGLALKTLHGDVDLSTSSGRLHARIMGSVARHEAERISERTARRHADIAREGKLSGGGHRAFGYDDDGMTTREDEAALVREAASRLLAGGSLRSVVRDWNARGVATVRGGKWSSTVLRQMLGRPRLAGLRSHKGVTYPGTWPAILDQDTHEALSALLGRNGGTIGRPPVHLLSGIATCGLCRGAMYGKTYRSDRPTAYTCLSCGKIRVAAAPVESIVAEYVLDVLESLETRTVARGDGPDPLVNLRALEAKLARLEDAYLDGGFDKATYLRRRGDLTAAIAALPTPRAVPAVPTGQDARAWWSRCDLETRRALIRRFLAGVEVGPGTPGHFKADRVALLVPVVDFNGEHVERVPGSFSRRLAGHVQAS